MQGTKTKRTVREWTSILHTNIYGDKAAATGPWYSDYFLVGEMSSLFRSFSTKRGQLDLGVLSATSLPFLCKKRHFMKCPFSELHASDVYKRSEPYAVNIRAKAWDSSRASISTRYGSGIVWGEDNIIITCFHVIHNVMGAISVGLYDHSWRHTAVLINADPIRDIVVLRIEGPKVELKPVKLRKAASVVIGEQVYAIGSPCGFPHSFSGGIVSGHRTFTNEKGQPIMKVIQTDCAMNEGSFGGPLVDA